MFGHSTPQLRVNHGKPTKAIDSAAAAPTSTGRGPSSWRASNAVPSGQTTSATAIDVRLAAAGTEPPVTGVTSAATACQSDG